MILFSFLIVIFWLAFYYVGIPYVLIWAVNTIAAAAGLAFYIQFTFVVWAATAILIWFLRAMFSKS
jgi:hypothetical protein